MRIFIILVLITLSISCSNNTVSNTKNIENEIVKEAINIANSHKNTDQIIKKLYTLISLLQNLLPTMNKKVY